MRFLSLGEQKELDMVYDSRLRLVDNKLNKTFPYKQQQLFTLLWDNKGKFLSLQEVTDTLYEGEEVNWFRTRCIDVYLHHIRKSFSIRGYKVSRRNGKGLMLLPSE